ncbi:uncharacterized protein Z518_02619 [Rhinocladiella mackenziei CBS 650.93]|uniref:Cupin type-2 domain-containing protein n=1 Tax=Rhinocladiella mackenziei CBS 650.93 TaxID=1442369 RepID=A0A0D2JFE8_9EURO|nr:uncharacterized protein Z518_02619 [Rhinocladiella mackenziei CBS 650.93]KIX07965.1 hypothetical protein Z518_02619 [Rhinocladiella mackenziei CBS 650.93]
MAMFPDPRRIVTGHDEQGNSIILKDSQIPCVPTGVKANFAVLWETSQFPASNNGSADPIDHKTQSLANDKGVVLRVVDIPANTVTMFHRTVSLDFGILFEGELDCHLDNGAVIHMKPGDVCVQRGTIHGWTNPSSKPARIYFILIAAEPVKIGDKILGDAGFHHEDVASGGK